MTADTDSAIIRQLEFELEKAEHGMALPYDAERLGQLRKMLVETRKRKLSAGLKAQAAEGWGQCLIAQNREAIFRQHLR